jgi:ubiquinone biosynthesis protein
MARLLTLLFEITSIFDMDTRTELVMLQKTMVVVEGVARKLDPQLNMWATAEPVVGGWIAQNVGPLGRLEDAGAALKLAGRLVAEIPGHIDQFARAMAAVERGLEPQARPSSAPLWVIAAILIWIAIRLGLR